MSGITYEIDDKNIVEQIKNDAQNAAKELIEKAHLSTGAIVVVGCSTSSTLGNDIGSHSVPEVGKAIFEGLQTWSRSPRLAAPSPQPATAPLNTPSPSSISKPTPGSTSGEPSSACTSKKSPFLSTCSSHISARQSSWPHVRAPNLSAANAPITMKI